MAIDATVWRQFCALHGDRTVHNSGFYATYEMAKKAEEDFELCQKDALAGNERAQRYMAKFVELRMKG